MRLHAFALLFLLFSSACGQDGQTHHCESVICLQGFCDSETGECANPDSCENARCVIGFDCVDDLCLPNTPCDKSTPCQRGQCFDGGCTNLNTCSASKDCLEGYTCEQNKCIENVCANSQCDRGLCDVLTGECVNEEICSSENQNENCIQGYYCYGQSCTKEKDICDDLNCVRGICDPAQAACVNDPSCSDDNACLENFFCEEGCQENKCVDGMCPRGVCENKSGSCINASPCSSPQECTDGFLCVVDQCLEIEKACGENGCEGNQICDYDPDSLAASCSENIGCRRALDCLGERVCENNQCVVAQACVNDSLEPNDILNDAVRISKSDNNFFEAVLCPADVDHFVYEVNDSDIFSGTLVVSLQIADQNIGSGSIRLKVTSPAGEVKESITSLPDANARVEFNVGALNRSDYLIEIRDESIEFGGAAYRIFAEVVETTLSQSCTMPTLLQSGQSINANSTAGSSFSLGSSCTDANNLAGENIYRFRLDHKSRVLIDVKALNDADLSFSIRRMCENSAIDLECVEKKGAGEDESLITFLDAGSYYLIVQGSQPNTGGPYTLTLNAEETICEFGEASCETQALSKFCAANQTEFKTRSCPDGCDPLSGFCLNETGESCVNPIDATMGYSGSVIYSSFTNDYQIPAGGCLPDRSGNTSSDGPDVAYTIHLEPQQILRASLDTSDRFENTSLYLVSQCSDATGTCLGGSNHYFSTMETLDYKNESANALDLFLIADVESANNYGPTSINIMVEDLICLPNSTRCAQNNMETCNLLGTAYDSQLCSAGCDVNSGMCTLPANDTCNSAQQLSAPLALTGRLGEFTNVYRPPVTCTGASNLGRDAVYSFTTSESGKVAQIQVDAQFDPSIYVVQDCSDLTSACQGSDTRSSNSETLEILVNPNTTYFIIVDSRSSRDVGEFTLSFDLKTPNCTPNQILGCQNAQALSYCSPLGITKTHTCAGGCANDACTTRSGDSCFESIIASTGRYTGNFTGSDASHFTSLDEGQCNVSSTKPGNDTIYEIAMNAGDSLFAHLTAPFDTSLYLLASCLESNSCISNAKSRNPSLTYTAMVDESIFLVVDRDVPFQSAAQFSLDLRVGPPDCVPGSPDICNNINSKIIYCDPLGYSQEYDCQGSCTAGRCDSPHGDACIDAIEMIDGQVEMGSLGNNSRTYNLQGPKQGNCRMSSQNSTSGKDTAYAVNLNPGDLLEASLETPSDAAQIYILRDCDDLSTCLSTNSQRASGSISYLADKIERVFIIVDSIYNFGNSPYTLTTTIRSGLVCQPATSYCNGGNVEICNLQGSGPDNGFSCANGCVDGGCNIDPNADICTAAPLTNGLFIYDSMANHTNDIVGSSGCSGFTGSGPDVSYQFQLIAGEVFHAQLESLGKEDLSLSILRDCSDPQGSCLAGQRTDGKSGKSDLYYRGTQSEIITLVVDSTSTADDAFSLLIQSLPQQCAIGNTPLTCEADSIRFCNAFGLYDFFDCDGTCFNGLCQNPSGASCVDPLLISDSISLTGQTFEAPNEVELEGVQGACNHASRTQGFEKIYALELEANERVDIRYASQTSATLMYLLGDCKDGQTCLDTTESGSRNGFLSYQASGAETIFLVIDRTISFPTSLSFSLDIQFRQACNIASPTVCVNATTIEGCATDGYTIQSDCTGACTNGSCAIPSGQFCSDAIVLAAGSSDTRSFDKSNSVIAEGSLGACSFPIATDGKNYIYSIDLLAGDILNLDYVSTHSATVMYFLSDCLDLGSCLAQDSGQSGAISYTALQDETIFVVMDREGSPTGTGTYTLTSTLLRPNCTIGDMPTCSMADEISYCVDQILGTSICASCANGSCPTPAANNCVDAIPTSDGALIHGNFEGDNALKMQGNIGACNFVNPTGGVDHFYKVSLLSGQTLTATYSSNSSLAILYVMGSCFDRTTCYDNTTSSQTGSVTYTAAQDEDVVLVMDRSTSGSTSTFTYDLSVTVN